MLQDIRFVPKQLSIEHDVDSHQVLQRVYKYGGQPFVRDYLAKHHGTTFDNTFGKKTGKAMMHSCAGRFVTNRINWVA
jgi:hypothetical protein